MSFVGAARFELATSCSQSRRDEPDYATPRKSIIQKTVCRKPLAAFPTSRDAIGLCDNPKIIHFQSSNIIFLKINHK